MRTKKFNGFDKKGYLPYGIYPMTLKEVEEIFSENKSLIRKKIMKEYKKHLNELKNTGYYIEHWIDGSFVTTKDNPNDIDTLTEFDGLGAEKNNSKEKIDNLIFNSKAHTNNCCHSFRVYRYPPIYKKDYEFYLKSKMRILIHLFGNKDNDPKGIIHLIGD